jgi:transcriptional regulator with XRE-family HTH domain
MDDNPRMKEDLKERLRQVIERKKLSMQEASLQAGLERSYLSKLFDGSIGSPTVKTIQKLADGLEVTSDWLVNGIEAAPIMDARDRGPDNASVLPYRDEMPNDVPVRGTAAGSHVKGAFQVTNDIIDYVRRPPALMGARDIYALYVEGESMAPEFHPAQIIFIHPNKPVRVGDAVVVNTSYHDGEYEGTIGIYRRRDEHWIVIGKHNPPAEVKIRRGNDTKVHKILTLNELFGI